MYCTRTRIAPVGCCLVCKGLWGVWGVWCCLFCCNFCELPVRLVRVSPFIRGRDFSNVGYSSRRWDLSGSSLPVVVVAVGSSFATCGFDMSDVSFCDLYVWGMRERGSELLRNGALEVSFSGVG